MAFVKLFLVVVFFHVTYPVGFGQGWAVRYNHPDNFDDVANAITVDSEGNIYVTGRSYGIGTYNDYLTIKYDKWGNVQWAARYNGSGNWVDEARAIAVDDNSNVYVTGVSRGATSGDDFLTIKYDSEGNEIWVVRFDGPENGWDEAVAIALDPSGNIYVTGFCACGGSLATREYATIKYNSSGDELWFARYPGSEPGIAGGRHAATALVVDSDGFVYVTGTSPGESANSDYATIKYHPDGTDMWVARYNGPGNADDTATAIVVDAFGNVYVTGNSRTEETMNDYATVKYNNAGIEQWVARYNGPANHNDYAVGLDVDQTGNVYVTGNSFGGFGTREDWATVKYNNAGEEQWSVRYNGSYNQADVPAAIAVDALGNINVTGHIHEQSGLYSDYFTIQYNSDGDEEWSDRYNNGPFNGNDEARAIAVDKSGNVYVTGFSQSASNHDFYTIKYELTGTSLTNDHNLPYVFNLEQNYPNPFNPSTLIRFSLPNRTAVSLDLYNTLGQRVRGILNEERDAGTHVINFDASNLPSGFYIYRLQAGEYVKSGKMLYLK